MKRFVDSQAPFVGYTLLEAQPMQAIANERRDVSSASAAEDESRGRVENALQRSSSLSVCEWRGSIGPPLPKGQKNKATIFRVKKWHSKAKALKRKRVKAVKQ